MIKILQSVFCIKYQSNCGTSFIINVNNKQYIITAAHVVPFLKEKDKLEILKNEKENHYWETISVIKIAELTNLDITILSSDEIKNNCPINLPTDERFLLSQDLYVLGFPLKLHHPKFNTRGELGPWYTNTSKIKIDGEHILFSNNNSIGLDFPFPLIKKGIITGIKYPMIITDVCNDGFSGGPIIINNDNKKTVIGVASSIIEDTGGVGLLLASSIIPVIDFIKKC